MLREAYVKVKVAAEIRNHAHVWATFAWQIVILTSHKTAQWTCTVEIFFRLWKKDLVHKSINTTTMFVPDWQTANMSQHVQLYGGGAGSIEAQKADVFPQGGLSCNDTLLKIGCSGNS